MYVCMSVRVYRGLVVSVVRCKSSCLEGGAEGRMVWCGGWGKRFVLARRQGVWGLRFWIYAEFVVVCLQNLRMGDRFCGSAPELCIEGSRCYMCVFWSELLDGKVSLCLVLVSAFRCLLEHCFEFVPWLYPLKMAEMGLQVK